MIKSPKEKFQSSQIRTGQWAQIVANPIFDEACDAALLHFMLTCPKTPESLYEMFGAQSLIRILKTIHETTKEPKEKTAQGLNYNAGV